MSTSCHFQSIAVACGGTGGHLFPGLAVARKLAQRDCDVTLMISSKEVDQNAVKNMRDFKVVTLPALCMKRGRQIAFLRGVCQSYKAAKNLFRTQAPDAALAMGGFSSAAPMLAAKSVGARTFLHESNTVPGRVNFWLSWIVDHAFVGFPCAAHRLRRCPVTVSGTPVRPQFHPQSAAASRSILGLESQRPVLLVMGGSQGASGVNRLVARALPRVAKVAPDWQWLHLAGPNDAEELRQVYASLNLTALVYPFFDKMELALGAASAAISRAGASSLAELSAMRLPALLVPYPAATANHQWHNARAFATSGAARLLEENQATPEIVTDSLLDLVRSETVRQTMQSALARWERPQAADEIAEAIVQSISKSESKAFAPGSVRPANAQTSGLNSASGSTASLLKPAVTGAPRREEPATI